MTTETIERGTAVERRDFVELHDDVSHSPLWNKDLAPTTIAQRTWSTWHIAALWIGMSVVISTYMIAGSMIEAGMTWWQAMLTVLLGNTIVLIPMCLNAHAGTNCAPASGRAARTCRRCSARSWPVGGSASRHGWARRRSTC
jgi:cytosine/uracil/thiamine/allantoin permease